MLLCYDPYLDADRVATAFLGAPLPALPHPDGRDPARRPGGDPLRPAGYRRGLGRVDVVDRVLTVRAERRAPEHEGDEPLELECAQGAVARDVLLGDDLDPRGLEHDYRDGVLVVRIPVVSRHAVARTEG